MKTPHNLEQLPLWVEGDLSEGEASSVQAHLAQCSTCRKTVEAIRASQAWLKKDEPSPFTLGDRQELRREVMARIQADHLKRTPAGRVFLKTRPLLLLAVAFGLFFAVTGLQRRQQKPAVLVAEQVPPPPVSAPVPAPPSFTRRAPVRATPAPRTAIRSEAMVASESALSRIEIQTGNPQIRIIWLARAEPTPAAPDPSTDRLVDPT